MTEAVLVFGIALVAAAIVGGGLKAANVVTIPQLDSIPRQALLGMFGLALIGAALAGVGPLGDQGPDDNDSAKGTPTAAPTEAPTAAPRSVPTALASSRAMVSCTVSPKPTVMLAGETTQIVLRTFDQGFQPLAGQSGQLYAAVAGVHKKLSDIVTDESGAATLDSAELLELDLSQPGPLTVVGSGDNWTPCTAELTAVSSADATFSSDGSLIVAWVRRPLDLILVGETVEATVAFWSLDGSALVGYELEYQVAESFIELLGAAPAGLCDDAAAGMIRCRVSPRQPSAQFTFSLRGVALSSDPVDQIVSVRRVADEFELRPPLASSTVVQVLGLPPLSGPGPKADIRCGAAEAASLVGADSVIVIGARTDVRCPGSVSGNVANHTFSVDARDLETRSVFLTASDPPLLIEELLPALLLPVGRHTVKLRACDDELCGAASLTIVVVRWPEALPNGGFDDALIAWRSGGSALAGTFPLVGGPVGGRPARRRTSAAVRCSGYLSLGTPYARSISGITLEGGA